MHYTDLHFVVLLSCSWRINLGQKMYTLLLCGLSVESKIFHAESQFVSSLLNYCICQNLIL